MTHDTPLNAVIENPDDDGPRPADADLLDQQGNTDRAEFMRIQCEGARLPEENLRRDELGLRKDELCESHKNVWQDFLDYLRLITGVELLSPAWKVAYGLGQALQLKAHSQRMEEPANCPSQGISRDALKRAIKDN